MRIIGLFAAAAVLFAIWIVYERRHPEPLVDIGLMSERAVLTTNLTALLVGFGMFGSFVLVPQLANGRRVNMDLSPYPTLLRIEAACQALPAFASAAPAKQPDAE